MVWEIAREELLSVIEDSDGTDHVQVLTTQGVIRHAICRIDELSRMRAETAMAHKESEKRIRELEDKYINLRKHMMKMKKAVSQVSNDEDPYRDLTRMASEALEENLEDPISLSRIKAIEQVREMEAERDFFKRKADTYQECFETYSTKDVVEVPVQTSAREIQDLLYRGFRLFYVAPKPFEDN